MDNYLEMILSRQKAASGEEHSQGVLQKLKSEIRATGREAALSAPVEQRYGEAELLRQNVLKEERNAALSQLSLQITEALQGEPVQRRIAGDTEKPEEGSGWIRYGVIPAEERQDGVQEQTGLSMDALSMYFERDARRYPG